MDYLELKTEVQQALPPDAADRIGMWVNWSVQDFLSRTRWSFLEVSPAAISLVASQQTYQLAGAAPVVTDFAGIIDVNLEITASGYREKMIEVPPQDFDMLAGGSRANGAPRIYTVVGGVLPSAGHANILSGALVNLLVWPIPLATAGNGVNLFLRYYRNTDSTPMSADTDVPIIPLSYHPAIVKLATATGLAAYDQESEAAFFQQQADKLIAQAIATDLTYRGGDKTVYTLKPLPMTPQALPLSPRDVNPAAGSATAG